MLTNQQLDLLRSKLVERQKEIADMLEDTDHFGLEIENVQDSVGELSNYDNHPGDTATALYERGKDVALNEHAETELNEIAHAFQRMTQNTYGTCEVCGKEIPLQRLEAIPTTSTCYEHSLNQEEVSDETRSLEEDVLYPGFDQYDYSGTNANFYDGEDTFQDVARYGTSETPSDFQAQGDIDNYSNTYYQSDDAVSYVEDYEAFAGNDLYGNDVKVYPNDLHEEYEERLDEDGVESVVGNIPYHKGDSYLEDELLHEDEWIEE
ncbi:hypothetical protein N781_17260 [Pontibacillus halophilus JSM 076056 = DSM 19796]|uniref:Zinc finger DksA/TraR C4-type domain-containing protein n=1 Tax=Pontibacillus halophilus JSM 076056 = DSM 19796 TaxID=1385510 RepID=A0A0A5GKF9_9BACI|nr:TraR/DksA C4-type zinc finger protein [Pontibacillus halophilus]KGX92464.1 hypothetical protein N781_17260 [Pontibacillus halophilus JSM 076056 = DSM 19796]